jgi:hypothetical protein
MQTVHIKNLEDFNPGYKDRELIWCKIYFAMINANPEFEMLCEIDKWRFVAFIMLELQTKKPVPVDSDYLTRKGFDLKKRHISLTLQMLHNSIEVCNGGVTEVLKVCNDSVTQSRVEKRRIEERECARAKVKILDYVLLTTEEHTKLISGYGKAITENYIHRLNNYIGSKGDKYKSHYSTILTWMDKDKVQKLPPPTKVKAESPPKINEKELTIENYYGHTVSTRGEKELLLKKFGDKFTEAVNTGKIILSEELKKG